MFFYANVRDEPRILWNVNNHKTIQAMTNHVESTSFEGNFETWNKTLHEICRFPGNVKPWVSMEDYHGMFTSPITLEYTTDLLPVLSWTSYGNCFADIRAPNPDYYLEYIHLHIH